MSTNMKRRIEALESAQATEAESLRMAVQFVGSGCGVVSALLLPEGVTLERGDNETEAAFLARVEAAR